MPLACYRCPKRGKGSRSLWGNRCTITWPNTQCNALLQDIADSRRTKTIDASAQGHICWCRCRELSQRYLEKWQTHIHVSVLFRHGRARHIFSELSPLVWHINHSLGCCNCGGTICRSREFQTSITPSLIERNCEVKSGWSRGRSVCARVEGTVLQEGHLYCPDCINWSRQDEWIVWPHFRTEALLRESKRYLTTVPWKTNQLRCKQAR